MFYSVAETSFLTQNMQEEMQYHFAEMSPSAHFLQLHIWWILTSSQLL